MLKQRKKEATPEKPREKEDIAVPKKEEKEIPKKKESQLGFRIAFVIVTLLSIVTRVWMLHHPDEVVFDEVHFGKFASYYLRGEYYFDVHPPLGKLLLAGVGYMVGYDGHFLFEKIGESYPDNNVPYVAFRLFCALCGATIIPVSFLILKEIGVSLAGCVLGALFLVFDNALITQSRLILLDSMLMLFCIVSVYFWIKFYKQRHQPFSLKWWFWLFMTGVGLGAVTGVKMVGLLTVATIGIATLSDLWEHLDIRRGLPLSTFAKHFGARALCLIIVPFICYLIPFYIHFELLQNSGPGDAFMSLKFQETLIGNKETVGATMIPYFSNLTIKHVGTGVHLHSHVHKIPLRHEDGRISSQGQQVNGYAHFDDNSKWIIEPVDADLVQWDRPSLSEREVQRSVRYVRNNDLVRLKHLTTNSYLKTHDVASPLTQTNMEMTTITDDANDYAQKILETVWKIEIPDADQGGMLKSKKEPFKIISHKYGVAVYTHKKPLPEWGFKMQEINGNKKTEDGGNLWKILQVEHKRIVNGTDIDEEPPNPKNRTKIRFGKKWAELQALMIHHNAALTQPHPYSSSPGTWPFVVRGISFWEKKDGFKQIYLLGHPITWWLSITGVLIYGTMWVLDRILLHRGVDDFGLNVRRWWDKSIGFLMVGWFMHYIPFFLMGRMLFLHHYLPSFIISVLITTALIDFFGRMSSFGPYMEHKTKISMKIWNSAKPGIIYSLVVLLLIGVTLGIFYYFMPLSYGTGFSSVEVIRQHKWLSTWDLQHA
ncbi:Dolichyl-phosphate-mannose-protein mannosyltransferase-domain-containing protein [Gorgonomyces haynaldii]|nr:Dolichyl-phosphate-mannose-protein mannosyltransferase-domain-containing protein [Gorgonomyces haynaldii]